MLSVSVRTDLHRCGSNLNQNIPRLGYKSSLRKPGKDHSPEPGFSCKVENTSIPQLFSSSTHELGSKKLWFFGSIAFSLHLAHPNTSFNRHPTN